MIEHSHRPAATLSASPPPNAASHWLAMLDPACFSVVMATGILSLACRQQSAGKDLAALCSATLLLINALLFVGLFGITAWRAIRYTKQVVADFSDHQRAFGFFSTIAASCVLGNGLRQLADFLTVAIALWWIGLVSWLIVTYAVFFGITAARKKPALRDGLHGGWLLAVVSTQSVSILASPLATELPFGVNGTLLLALSFWLVGGMLYVVLISLIFYRYCFEPMTAASMTPPYWINMGAMAISTVAGNALLDASTAGSTLQQFEPFIKGLTLLYWATATWWIPLLVILGCWRHFVHRIPFRYDTRYWSMVFPLGMYSVATYEVHRWLTLPFFLSLASWFTCFALLAWLATAIGLFRHVVRTIRGME